MYSIPLVPFESTRARNKQHVNEKNLESSLSKNPILVTALNPIIGYEKAAEIAKKAYTENITLKDAAIKLDYLDSKEFDLIVDPKKMVKGD